MRLDIAIYGALLAGGLGAAYWASMPETDSDDERVAVVAIDPKAIAEVTYKTKGGGADVKRRDDGRYWVTFTKTEAPPAKEPAKKDPKADLDPLAKGESDAAAVTPATDAGTVTTERFLANEKLAELTAALNPLRAQRVIGKVDDAQLEEFGLKDRSDSVTFKTDAGKETTFYLGKRSYGSRNRFLLEGGEGGRVLLVDDQGFESLEKANMRMYDRRLVAFEFEDVTHAAVTAKGKTKRMAHTQRSKDGELQWTDDEEGAPAKPSYASWTDKLSKLRLTEYADATQEQALASEKPFLTVVLEKGGKALDTLQFKKQAGTPAAYWVYSDFLKAHAKVVQARMEPVEKDIDAIVGG